MSLNSGELYINQKRIYHGIDVETFEEMFSEECERYGTGKIVRFVFSKAVEISNLSFWVIVKFRRGYIKTIELKNSDVTLKNSYEDWDYY